MECEEPPSGINPYEVLGVDEQASADQIKTAYRKQALRHHPDKVSVEAKEDAHKKFQDIAFAYAILSDERRRRRYDTTGSTAETLDLEDDDFDWSDFYREQFDVVINSSLLDEFKKEYQGSAEEKADLLRAYEECEGDMDGVYERVMASDVLEDDRRFRRIITDAIKDGEAADHPAFSAETKEKQRARMRAARKEAGEAMELARELGVEEQLFGTKGDGQKKKKQAKTKKGGQTDGGEAALMALIQQRQKSRSEGFLASLEAKYAPKPNGNKKKRAADDEPPEEAFHKPRTKSRGQGQGRDQGQASSRRKTKSQAD